MNKRGKYQYSKKYRHIRKKKSIFKNRYFWFFLTGVFVFCGFFYFFIFSPVFQIQTISIQKTNFINKQEVEKGVEKIIEKKVLFLPTKSIFILNKKEIKNFVLENFFPAQKVIVKKALLHKLLIEIQEKRTSAIACSKEQCCLIDELGFAFYRISKDDISEDMPMIFFGHLINEKEKLLDEEILSFVSSIHIGLKKREILVQEFKVSPSKIEVKTANDLLFYFSPQKNPDLQIEDLILLLKDEIISETDKIEYIDLRFDKIFYK